MLLENVRQERIRFDGDGPKLHVYPGGWLMIGRPSIHHRGGITTYNYVTAITALRTVITLFLHELKSNLNKNTINK
jgi:hypothetical protein